MTTVPSNLVPTRISQLTEYTGQSTDGYLPYVLNGITYKVQFSQIAAVGAVPSTRTITGGDGLGGGGDLSENRVITLLDGGVTYSKLADSGVAAGSYGSASTIPVLDIDAKGRVTGATTVNIDLGGYVPASRSIIAGDGLSGGGTLAADRTISLVLTAATPLSGGAATAGSSTVAARDDHVHPAVNLTDTTETSGVLPMSRGGTGSSLSPAAGAILYSTGSQVALAGAGSAGQFFTSNGVAGPSWADITGGTTGLTFGFAGSDLALGGTLAITNGGTGATTLTQARINLLPSYTGNAGKVLALNAGATDLEWLAITGTGTVTSVAVSGGTTGLTTTGSPITGAGTITLGGTLNVANGGTGAATSADARTNLLPAYAGNAGKALIVNPGETDAVWGSVGGVTSVDASGGTTGLTFSGGPITGAGTLTLSGTLALANGGTGATDASGARTALGLGTSAVLDAGSALGVATLDAGGTIPLSQIPASIQGGVSYQGTWNASTNTPTLTSSVGTKGYYYVVSTPGSTDLNGITSWNIGDWAIFNGTAWEKVDNTDAVTSVNGFTGSVVLTTTNVAEGTNEYFTTARARTSLSAGTGIGYDNTTGVISNTAPDQTVALTAGTGISVTGTYPNFTLTNTAPDQVVSLTAGSNVSITGTYPNFTIASSNSGGTVTSVSGTGTVNGITLTGTVTSSGSLTLGGTLSGVSLTTQVTGTLPVANGGTGAATLAANAVLLGNGTSAVQTVAPGTNGNVLVSNGTTWVSQAPAPSGVTQARATALAMVFGL